MMQEKLIVKLDTAERREIVARIEDSLADVRRERVVDLGLDEVRLYGKFSPEDLCRIASAQRAITWTLCRG